jgi:hypothetical protein
MAGAAVYLMKQRKVTIKRGETEITVTPEDFYTWIIGGIALVASITFSILLLQGKMDAATIAFSFLTGMGVTEGVRHIIVKNTAFRKWKRK